MGTIADFSGNFNKDELKRALENVKIKDLKKYKMTWKVPEFFSKVYTAYILQLVKAKIRTLSV